MQENATLKTMTASTSSSFENIDLSQLAQQLGYTVDEFYRAVTKVFSNRDAIQEYLSLNNSNEKIY